MGSARPFHRSALLVCALLGIHGSASAQQVTSADLRRLTLEELGNITVTSVSKAEETLSGAAAAVTVLTSEDIRRSGSTTVPEVLRMAPGIHVAHQTANIWAVSSRGFSSTSSEKLLVLTDTRSIYTPLFAGVLWDVQDVLLEDVDRIEVIRGPGAALWGSNAVNGVINVTTKSAGDTQGLYVSSTVGSEERFAASARYGGRIGSAAYRVYGKYADRDSSFTTGVQRDDWQLGHGGVRIDWDRNPSSTFTLQGEAYGAEIGRLSPSISVAGRPGPSGLLRTRASGGNVLGRWRRRPSADSELQLRVYYDRTHRNDPSYVDDLDTVDTDLQQRSRFGRHEVVWGANYRLTSNHNVGNVILNLEPHSSRDHVISGFVQHQVQLGTALRVTTGAKLEHNEFSGGEVQPSLRASWDFASSQTLWGSVSRAARIPTRLERDIAVDVTAPTSNPIIRLLGSEAFDSERLIAFEAGYRWLSSAAFLLDLAAYHNRYAGLASLEQGTPFVSGGRTVVPIVNVNLTDGQAQGVEALVTVIPNSRWRLFASSTTTWLNLTAHGRDLNRGALLEGATPRHQLGLRSMIDLGPAVKLDASFRHLTALRRLPSITAEMGLPSYAELDLRAAWQATRQLELSVVGQNLLAARHVEFGAPTSRGEIERAVYASVAWRR